MTPARLKNVGDRRERAARGRRIARVSRSQRRRPLGVLVRDDLRLQLRPEHRTRFTREARPRRPTPRRAATRCARCSPRNSARCCKWPMPRRRTFSTCCARRASTVTRTSLVARTTRTRWRFRAGGAVLLQADREVAAPNLGRSELAHCAAARQSRERRFRASSQGRRRLIPGLARASHLHSVVTEAPAITGARPRVAILREQGVNSHRRDELRDGEGGLRDGGRPHDRFAERPAEAGDLPRLRGVRRLHVWRHAGRGRRLGALHHVQSRAGRAVQGVLRAARTPSRSASATVAR
jgi:hypothetical protein